MDKNYAYITIRGCPDTYYIQNTEDHWVDLLMLKENDELRIRGIGFLRVISTKVNLGYMQGIQQNFISIKTERFWDTAQLQAEESKARLERLLMHTARHNINAY